MSGFWRKSEKGDYFESLPFEYLKIFSVSARGRFWCWRRGEGGTGGAYSGFTETYRKLGILVTFP